MPITAQMLRNVMAEARPIIERQMNDAKLIAGFRDLIASNGGDWSALKALIKAHVEDEADDDGEGKRVRKILDKADSSTAYADMLGLAKMNENNFSAASYAEEKGRGEAKLVETVAAGVQTEIGRAALTVAIDAMLAVDEIADPETGEIIETQESAVSSDRNEPGRDASLNAPTGSASDEMPETVSPAHFLRAGDDGRPQTSTEAYQVKDAGQGGIIVGVYSEQEKAGGPQGGNEAASGLPAPVANPAPVIGHVSFATSSHINPDDMPEIPAFLRRDFERAEA